MSIGFRIREVMSGTHAFEPSCGPPVTLPMEFRVFWGARDARRFFDPRADEFLEAQLAGTVTVGGLCEEAPCQGRLELKYFSNRTIRYTFDFEADGKPYHFVGEKVNLWPWNLPVSHTTCFGTLTEKETGKLVSRSVTHFRVRSSLRFLTSLRLTSG